MSGVWHTLAASYYGHFGKNTHVLLAFRLLRLVLGVGAGEDVEGVLARLQAQALEERLQLVRAQRNKLLSAFENLQCSGQSLCIL